MSFNSQELAALRPGGHRDAGDTLAGEANFLSWHFRFNRHCFLSCFQLEDWQATDSDLQKLADLAFDADRAKQNAEDMAGSRRETMKMTDGTATELNGAAAVATVSFRASKGILCTCCFAFVAPAADDIGLVQQRNFHVVNHHSRSTR
eukprot:6464908-Amphidinium_carterae.1